MVPYSPSKWVLPPSNAHTMQNSDLYIMAAGLLAIVLTAALWVRVTRKVRTEEHPVMHVKRADTVATRVAFPG